MIPHSDQVSIYSFTTLASVAPQPKLGGWRASVCASAQGELAPGDPAEPHGRAELLVVTPVRRAVPVLFHERPDHGVVGVPGEHELFVDLAAGPDRPPQHVDSLERHPPRAVAPYSVT